MKIFRASYLLLILATACGTKENPYDAAGYFEAAEVIVSAQQQGELRSFSVTEGGILQLGDSVGQIDVTMAELQKQQAEASIAALKNKTFTDSEQTTLIRRQLAVLQAKLDQQLREKTRTENLIKMDAATSKQLDDIKSEIDQLQGQIAVAKQEIRVSSNNVSTQNRSILSEQAPLQKTVAQFDEQISKGKVINPLSGVVLSKYALRGELMTPGKPLYKIANIDTLTLRAYVSGIQIPQIKLGQKVRVRIESNNGYKYYPGTIAWVSATSEFTPKTIQTKNERENLVYATKISVKNDGALKIGMYGELLLNDTPSK